MLHILLLIMKIIGITLLALLLFILLVLALVLFVPVRYRGKGLYYEDLNTKVTVSWLFHLVHFSLKFENNQQVWKLRILGIPFKGSNRIEKNKKQNKKREEHHYQDEEDNDKFFTEDEEIEISSIKTSSDSLQNSNEKDSKSAESFSDRIIGFFNLSRERVQGFIEKLKSIRNKIVDIIENIKYAWRWWNMETTKLAVSHCKDELLILLKHICPRKYNVDLKFGTGDPATTGQILGVIGIFYPITKGQLEVTPNFDEKMIEGTFDVKGRVFAYKLLGVAWRVFWDKNVRSAYSSWNKRTA